MKQVNLLILIAVLSLLFRPSFAQNINWKSLQPTQKNIVNLNLGFESAAVAGIGYGYHLKTRTPIVLNIEYSMPFGDKTFDDLKTKIGGQVNLIHATSFFTTVKAYSVIRSYRNDLVRMINFGSEFAATAGVYKQKWFVAGDFGFDKAITTHLKHSALANEYTPGIKSGWYIPDGGNFIYGLQAGYTFKRNDLYAKFGKTISQDLKNLPTVPFYFQLGLSVRLQ
jgi:hypothetical protein